MAKLVWVEGALRNPPQMPAAVVDPGAVAAAAKAVGKPVRRVRPARRAWP